MSAHDSIRPIRWTQDALELLDQRLLPGEERYLRYARSAEVAAAIRDMVVRGAPAIGISAAFGVVLAVREARQEAAEDWRAALEPKLEALARARPTAINLFWALSRLRRCLETAADPEAAALAEAQAIYEEDLAANLYMGEQGAALMDGQGAVITHCNTGSLATAGYGTALGVIRSAYSAGKITRVYADETRPWLQGARLTAWELVKDRIPVSLVADSAAPFLMSKGEITWTIVGADRITANGDVANKIGTYGLALAARAHGLKFMVVAPSSTIDWTLDTGADIPIEDRAADELLSIQGQRIAAEGAEAWNPVFDVTPARLVDVLVTELGVVHRPSAESMAKLKDKESTWRI